MTMPVAAVPAPAAPAPTLYAPAPAQPAQPPPSSFSPPPAQPAMQPAATPMMGGGASPGFASPFARVLGGGLGGPLITDY
jgi:5'-nucleotidase